MHGDVVAKAFDRLTREGFVHAFDFLQADDVGLPFLQPGQQVV